MTGIIVNGLILCVQGAILKQEHRRIIFIFNFNTHLRMHTYFKGASKAFLGWRAGPGGKGGVCQSHVSGQRLPSCGMPAHAHPLHTPVRGASVPPKPPPQGAGSYHPLAEAPTTSPSTRRRSQVWEPQRPRLSSPAPLSLATQLWGFLHLAARLWFSSVLTFIPLPSRSRAAARAEPTAGPRVVPEAQPPLLLEPLQRELLAAAIMVSWGGGLGRTPVVVSRVAETRLFWHSVGGVLKSGSPLFLIRGAGLGAP